MKEFLKIMAIIEGMVSFINAFITEAIVYFIRAMCGGLGLWFLLLSLFLMVNNVYSDGDIYYLHVVLILWVIYGVLGALFLKAIDEYHKATDESHKPDNKR